MIVIRYELQYNINVTQQKIVTMGKKKKAQRKKPEPSDMIHFRPGSELGGLIGKLAEQLDLSRGEVAKRMTSLASED